MSPPVRTGAVLLIVGLFSGLASTGCASQSAISLKSPSRMLVMTPVDGIPVRSRDALPPTAEPDDFEAARVAALRALRTDIAGTVRARGVEVVEDDATPPGRDLPEPADLAARGRAAGAETVLATRLVAYGDLRRSWIWILGAQALAAGIGHGVVVAAATGNQTLGWWAGAGEFALESATWVGGALVGSRGIDPVLVRIVLIRSRDGAILKRWTREGTRPLRKWFRRRGQPPREERLRTVAHHVFAEFAPKLIRRLDKERAVGTPPSETASRSRSASPHSAAARRASTSARGSAQALRIR